MAGECHEPGKMTFVIPTARIANFPVGAVVDDTDIRRDPIRGRVVEVKPGNAAAIVVVEAVGQDLG